MAAIFIVAGLAIADKVEKKKEAKRLKKERDEVRYRELQIETNRRLAARTQSGGSNNVIDTSATATEYPDAEDERLSDQEKEMQTAAAVDDAPPPRYEDAVAVGERREREWQARMQRRRSSVQSHGSSSVGGGRGQSESSRRD